MQGALCHEEMLRRVQKGINEAGRNGRDQNRTSPLEHHNSLQMHLDQTEDPSAYLRNLRSFSVMTVLAAWG